MTLQCGRKGGCICGCCSWCRTCTCCCRRNRTGCASKGTGQDRTRTEAIHLTSPPPLATCLLNTYTKCCSRMPQLHPSRKSNFTNFSEDEESEQLNENYNGGAKFGKNNWKVVKHLSISRNLFLNNFNSQSKNK